MCGIWKMSEQKAAINGIGFAMKNTKIIGKNQHQRRKKRDCGERERSAFAKFRCFVISFTFVKYLIHLKKKKQLTQLEKLATHTLKH